MLKGSLEELKELRQFLSTKGLTFSAKSISNAVSAVEEREREIRELANYLKETDGTPEFYEKLALIITDLCHAVAIAQHDAEVSGADTAYGRS